MVMRSPQLYAPHYAGAHSCTEQRKGAAKGAASEKAKGAAKGAATEKANDKAKGLEAKTSASACSRERSRSTGEGRLGPNALQPYVRKPYA